MARRARSRNAVTSRRIATGRTMNNVEGLGEVRELLERLKARVPSEYQRELTDAGMHIKNIAQSHVNNISGALSSSIRKESKFTQTKQQVNVKAGGIKAPHAHLVEYGHRQISKSGVVGDVDVPAHPFLRKAFEEYKETLLQKLNQAINRITSS